MLQAAIGLDGVDARQQEARSFRFSTEVLPERDRVGVFREVFGRNILGMDVEPIGEGRFRTDMVVKQLPGLNIVWAHNSPLRASRTRQLLSDGKDGFAFQWSSSSGYGEHLGREVALGCNDGILISCSDPGEIALPDAGPMVSLTFPREALGLQPQNLCDCAARPVPANTPALALLARYIDILKDEHATVTPELQKLAAAHVFDLLALALGSAPGSLQVAQRRGLGAAHLGAIKKEIADGYHRKLSIETIAARYRLSPRHVQRLFEEDGTSFTHFVGEQRLLRAYRMLTSPRFRHLRVTDIALEAGFGDLSWFNRKFRQRFGASPSDVRGSPTQRE